MKRRDHTPAARARTWYRLSRASERIAEHGANEVQHPRRHFAIPHAATASIQRIVRDRAPNSVHYAALELLPNEIYAVIEGD